MNKKTKKYIKKSIRHTLKLWDKILSEEIEKENKKRKETKLLYRHHYKQTAAAAGRTMINNKCRYKYGHFILTCSKTRQQNNIHINCNGQEQHMTTLYDIGDEIEVTLKGRVASYSVDEVGDCYIIELYDIEPEWAKAYFDTAALKKISRKEEHGYTVEFENGRPKVKLSLT